MPNIIADLTYEIEEFFATFLSLIILYWMVFSLIGKIAHVFGVAFALMIFTKVLGF